MDKIQPTYRWAKKHGVHNFLIIQDIHIVSY